MTKPISEMTVAELTEEHDFNLGILRSSWRLNWTKGIALILANQYDAELTRRSKEK